MNVATSLAEARRIAAQRRVRDALTAAMAVVKSVIEATEPATNAPLPVIDRNGDLCYHVNVMQILAAALPTMNDRSVWKDHSRFVFHSITELTGLGVLWDGVSDDIYIAELPYGREFELIPIPAPAVAQAAPALVQAAPVAPAAATSAMGLPHTRRAAPAPHVRVHYVDIFTQPAGRDGDEAVPAAADCPASPPAQRRLPPVCPGAPKSVKHTTRLQ